MNRFLLAALLALCAVAPTPAQAPGGLDLVPTNVWAFGHVQLRDAWASDLLSMYREPLTRLDPKLWDLYLKRWPFPPETLDRLTVFILPPSEASPQPMPVAVLTTTAPIDPKAVLKLVPEPQRVAVGMKEYYTIAESPMGLAFPERTTVLLGPPWYLESFLKGEVKPAAGATLDALAVAARRTFTVWINGDGLQPAIQGLPEPYATLLKANSALASLEMRKGLKLDVDLTYPDAAKADRAVNVIKAGLTLARAELTRLRADMERKLLGPVPEVPSSNDIGEAAGSLFGLALIRQIDKYLDEIPLKQDGRSLRVTVEVPERILNGGDVPTTAVMIGLLLPAVQKVRGAAQRTQSMNNLRQIGLAMHNYHDTSGSLPPAAICDKQGKPLLSWRVAILPYIENEELYKKFKLDEPWDSEHNKKLLPLMPRIYAIPSDRQAPPGERTHYRVFVGKGTVFEKQKDPKVGVKLQDITDGTSNTLLVVEAADAVEWTKPEELEFAANKPLPALGKFWDGGALVLMTDGAVRLLKDTSEKMLRPAITRNGGEPLPEGW